MSISCPTVVVQLRAIQLIMQKVNLIDQRIWKLFERLTLRREMVEEMSPKQMSNHRRRRIWMISSRVLKFHDPSWTRLFSWVDATNIVILLVEILHWKDLLRINNKNVSTCACQISANNKNLIFRRVETIYELTNKPLEHTSPVISEDSLHNHLSGYAPKVCW